MPQRYAQNLNVLITGATEWVKFQASRAKRRQPPAVRLEQISNNQIVPYYARSFNAGDLQLADPIIFVVTGDSGVIANDQYTSIASRGELLIEDPDRAMRGLADAGVDAYVLGMSPFAQEAADDYRKEKREFALQTFNAMATIAILFITALALSIAYSRRNAQTLFVKYICGWSFVRVHWRILTVEAVLILIFASWTWHSTATTIHRYELPGAPPPPAGVLALLGLVPILAGSVALLSLALFVLALSRTNAGVVRNRSASIS